MSAGRTGGDAYVPSDFGLRIDGKIQRATQNATTTPSNDAQTTSERKCAATYIRENAINIGIHRNARPIRQLANASVAKNAVDVTVCPDGNAL